MTHILVTGGLGFIGAEFVNTLLSRKNPPKVTIIDKKTYAADVARLNYEVDIIYDDINNIHKYTSLKNCHYVVNFAAETHVDNSVSDGSPFYHSNVLGVFQLVEFFKTSTTLKKFIQISTDEVYGDMNDLRGIPEANEQFHLVPSSYYSASKASADLLVQSAARTYGLPYLITRSCNNFGENQHPEKFIPKIFECLKLDREVPLYGDGRQKREWIHVTDNVEIISNLMYSDTIVNEVVNIGSGYRYQNIDILQKLSDLHKYGKLKVKKVKDRLGHDVIYQLDTSKLKNYLGDDFVFTPLETFLHAMVTRSSFLQDLNGT